MNRKPPNRILIAALLGLLISISTTHDVARAESQPEEIESVNEPTADVIIVVGAAGEAEFGEAFTTWAERWREVAETAGANISSIGLKTESPDASATDHQPNRERLQTELAGLEPSGTAPVWIVMMGHGTFSQNVAKFNLRGPDISAEELSRWIEPITRPLVVVNAFSSSGPFINALSGENRVIVTATRSGTEQNFSRFGDYLSQAIGDESSDIDHDGEVSILEAFLAASAATRDFYQSAGRIATEHALIDDNTDGLGTPATAFRGTRVVAKASNPDQSVDGRLASRISLSPASTRLRLSETQLKERTEIETQLDQFRTHRAEMSGAEYEAAVLPLLIRLAQIYQVAEAAADQN